MVDEKGWHTSGLVAASLTWDNAAAARQRPRHLRTLLATESIRWQQISQWGAKAEMDAYPVPIFVKSTGRRKYRSVHRPPREANRILELHGLIGAIGEQAGLAWTAEQDVQRLRATRRYRDAEHQRLVQRAVAETCALFVLGAAHGLANLAMRLLLLNEDSSAVLDKKYPNAAGFPPGSNDRSAWVTLNKNTTSELQKAAMASGNQFMSVAIVLMTNLEAAQSFRALDSRRRLDYHRRRPQSIPHTSPRGGTVTRTPGQVAISMVAPRLEPEADADAVHEVAVALFPLLRSTMCRFRKIMPKAIRKEGIFYAMR